MNLQEIKDFLEAKYLQYNNPAFIENDPVSIPHFFSKKEDIEIAGFLSSTIAWGQRKTILKNARHLMNMMDNAPFDFIMNHTTKDLDRFKSFKHRTFKGEDCIFFLNTLQHIYKKSGGLEASFLSNLKGSDDLIYRAILRFRNTFFSFPHELRTEKHVSNPARGASAKRLNMFLRWMIRKDKSGIDFGLWNSVKPSELICPLDIHSGNVARKLGLLTRKQNDWKAAIELTGNLKKMDYSDPVKYDLALFCLGVYEKF